MNWHVLVVFGVVDLVKCPDASSASFWVHYNIPHLLTYLLLLCELSADDRNVLLFDHLTLGSVAALAIDIRALP